MDYSSHLQQRYLRRSGEVFTFGSGDCGQLGHGDETEEDLTANVPRVVASLRSVAVCFDFVIFYSSCLHAVIKRLL